MQRGGVILALGYVAVSAAIMAQSPATPPAAVKPAPALTEAQKLGLQNAILRLENAQLKYQMAGEAFAAAQTAIRAQLEGLKVDGYELDLGTLTYAPAKPAGGGK